jgi:ATP-binding cassette subfamily B protein
LTLVVDIAVLVGLIIGMALLSWQLTLCTLIILPIVGGIVQWFSKALKAAMVKARVKIAALNAYTQECLYGHVTIKVLTGEKAASKTFDRYNKEYRDAQMSSVILDAMMFAVLDGIASITVGLVLWVAASKLGLTTSLSSTMSAGIIVAFVQYIQQLFDPLKNLGNKMAMLQGAFSSIDRIFGILATEDKIPGEKKLAVMGGHVRFDHVNFRYGEDGGAILKDVSFDLPPGESLAIVGPTGSGKSTIIKLLSKLYDSYEGHILIDGHELSPLAPEPLRRHMAIVPQDIVLFDGSIAFNISLGLTGVTLDDVKRAARQVGADAFIEKLPGGYDYHLKEGGINLSHGQRQLITFARALARRPSLVILDEATSSVDPESESIVQAAIQNLLKGRTVIVIAHRLSTIRQCDQILVLERGQVVEHGRHETLLEKGGAYHKLHTAFD